MSKPILAQEELLTEVDQLAEFAIWSLISQRNSFKLVSVLISDRNDHLRAHLVTIFIEECLEHRLIQQEWSFLNSDTRDLHRFNFLLSPAFDLLPVKHLVSHAEEQFCKVWVLAWTSPCTASVPPHVGKTNHHCHFAWQTTIIHRCSHLLTFGSCVCLVVRPCQILDDMSDITM